MWRRIRRHVLRTSASSCLFFPPFHGSVILSPRQFKFKPSASAYELTSSNLSSLVRIGQFRQNNDGSFGGLFTGVIRLVLPFSKGHATAAETAEVASSTDVDEDAEQIKASPTHNRRKLPWLGERLHVGRGMTSAKYKALKRRQVKIETEAWERAAKEYQELLKDMCERKLAPNLPYMKSLFLGWFQPFRDAILTDQESELLASNKATASYAQYFNQLPADMMAVLTMHKLVGLLMTGTDGGRVRVVKAACSIGEAVEHEASIHKFLKKTKKKRVAESGKEEGGVFLKLTPEQESLRKRVNDLLKKQKLSTTRHIVKGQNVSKPWGQDIRAKVGSRLIELLMQTAYIQAPIDQLHGTSPDVRPAFLHRVHNITCEANKFSRRYGMIECDPLVLKGLDRAARHMVIPYMPMLVPPINWSGYDKGGHFFLPSFVMRIHGSKNQREAVKRVSKQQINPVFEALNTLGHTKWRVNKRVLNVVDKVWALGGGLADLVECSVIQLPDEPDTEDENEIRKWKWKVRNVHKENRERHSQQCDIELKLAVARKMKDEEGFYFPHNLDFRGRAYPMHPHLNHLGSDLCRGILEFGEGRPLGKSGLQWLKIHLANLFAGGVDKLSLEGRIAFTEAHVDDIFDSSDRPLEGNRWWLKAEDPFQCLAVCINLAEALRSLSPETCISHIPVHQDGSCNGLQHYAALGRDKVNTTSIFGVRFRGVVCTYILVLCWG
uniref:DNA-directed RNA polymerase n=1 Tax=Kalanchoe fedtschenkoi TaxID=63787 RepID=A0A7N0T8Q2_KALFE